VQDSKNIRSKLYAVAQLVGALRYEVGGLGFDSWWGHSGRTMVLESTRHL